MAFSFQASTNLNDRLSTAYVRPVFEVQKAETEAYIRGAMLTLFGEPLATSENAESAFDYVIIATDDDGKTCILTVYQRNIGGQIKDGDFVRSAADALAVLIQNATPSDFESITYYEDADAKITYGCKDGVAYCQTEYGIAPPWLGN